jgi:hypothetical protein
MSTTDFTKMEIHPLAEIFPPLKDEDLTKLSEDIKANKLQVPITTFENKILDGRTR